MQTPERGPGWRVVHADCLETMARMRPESVDSIVTDPPYGLAFMGKHWDHGVPGVDFWREALRVAKPGTHLLAFGGTRTFHRLVVAIEDAGWEVRDCIAWVYGSGFPKSLNVSLTMDKNARGAPQGGFDPEKRGRGRVPDRNALGMGGATGKAPSGLAEAAAPYEPSTDLAKQWDGWGTALKPAMEPICVARKPLVGTVAANVSQFGTGALNIDAARVATTENLNGGAYATVGGRSESQSLHGGSGMNVPGKTVGTAFVQPPGRWPANLVHDGSDEVLVGFPESKGQQGDLRGHSKDRISKGIFGDMKAARDAPKRGDSGSAARFFYTAKASKRERLLSNGEHHKHPTTKPLALMRWLVRLVTPPGGIVLDPFTGSGTTGVAAIREGFRFVGIEREAQYVEIARARLAHEAPDAG